LVKEHRAQGGAWGRTGAGEGVGTGSGGRSEESKISLGFSDKGEEWSEYLFEFSKKSECRRKHSKFSIIGLEPEASRPSSLANL